MALVTAGGLFPLLASRRARGAARGRTASWHSGRGNEGRPRAGVRDGSRGTLAGQIVGRTGRIRTSDPLLQGRGNGYRMFLRLGLQHPESASLPETSLPGASSPILRQRP